MPKRTNTEMIRRRAMKASIASSYPNVTVEVSWTAGTTARPRHDTSAEHSRGQPLTDHSAMFQNACVGIGLATYPSRRSLVAEMVRGE